MTLPPPTPVEVAIAEVFADRARRRNHIYFVTDINAEVADALNWVATAWYISEAIQRDYGARRRRWERGRVLVYDFPHVDEDGAPVPISAATQVATP